MKASRLRKWTLIGVGAVLGSTLIAGPVTADNAAAAPIDSAELTTWSHDESEDTLGPVDDGVVRRSKFYEASVATNSDPDNAHESFVYMGVPRSGEGEPEYDDQDGAEFSSSAGLTMSWSSFEYSTDVWVNVTLTTGEAINSADEVTIRPTNLNFEKELVDESTIRVKVPYNEHGYRFSVEFAPQQFTAYNDLSGTSGVLTTEADGNVAVHTEPRNSMLVFANPKLTGAEANELIPTADAGTIYRPNPRAVDALDDIEEEIVYFEPGTYYMGSKYHARLPESVKWVYLAPGAYVKGAFQFVHDTQKDFKVTGRGVLSGEQYVYEADTRIDYEHRENESNCHVDCVKMLQFESSNEGQSLDIEGITIAQPPYHSFVVYAHDESGEIEVEDFVMDVKNYKQVGSWYWQTDGIELYSGGRMHSTFFHANDDVLKMYHDDVKIEDTVIWKNENGPVIQWGWVPREINDVTVTNTDVIHNRMYWKDVKYNTCVFNSSTHYEDMGAEDRADLDTMVQNMEFVITRVEGMLNCGIRVFAMSNTENITIDGFAVESWNDLDVNAQSSLLKRMGDSTGNKVTIGDEMTDQNGILLHNYTVGGVPIHKAGNNWAKNELGRLNFDAETWENWNATSDSESDGPAPLLKIDDLSDGSVVSSRDAVVKGVTDAATVTVRVNGAETEANITDGNFSVPVTFSEIFNEVVITATASNGAMTVERFTITALGTHLGYLTDPEGDDNGPGSYTYPTNSVFNPGSLDLTGFDVYEDGDVVRLVVSTAGSINNPWGGDGMSTQRVNIYLRDGDSTETTELLPGTNMSAAGAWKYVVVADGRAESGIFAPGPGNISDVTLNVDPDGQIIATAPADVFEGVDLREVGYQVSMFSNDDEADSVGNVRPIHSAECAAGEGCESWIGEFRGGGGAGEHMDEAPYDTDTSDSNAFDIISGDADQSVVMDWNNGPVVAPYVQLISENDEDGSNEDGSNEDGTDHNGSDGIGAGEEGSGQDGTDQSGAENAADEESAEAADSSSDSGHKRLPITGVSVLGPLILSIALIVTGGALFFRRKLVK